MQNKELWRWFWMLLGLLAFGVTAWWPDLPDAVTPDGAPVGLDREAQLALALFMLAAVWWVFEVIPIGITAIAIGVAQAGFNIREPRVAWTDFFDPSVWFIFGSVIVGLVFTQTGLTRRLAYAMLIAVGEKTRNIYLGAFTLTAAMTLVMAHTAVAASVFPVLMAIHHLYSEDDQVTRFGAGLFVGMAFTAGAGSIITLFGAARSAVGIGFFRELAGREIDFFELTWYMAPLGITMVFLLWLYVLVVFSPERAVIPGLRERAKALYEKLGPMSAREIAAIVITLGAVLLMGLRHFVPALSGIDKSAVILSATVLFFALRILRARDLESVSWNIILLFGGAMSIGFCLWQTGAARWLAMHWLSFLTNAPALAFIIGVGVFVLVMTNLIMNVAAIAISLPVALVIAPFMGVAPEPILFTSLAVAGMPFLLLVGAAPNAIAYNSRQFTTGRFFLAGVPASVMLILVITVFVWKIWPWMGMPVLLTPG
ncbi:MAG: SLC13/DASS family transporter [Gammaproteobacteria bacterium]|nr:SLC13/DASS family transporter [Gammaproteobacteria bacterium]